MKIRIRDPGILLIRDEKIRIRDKHPGSATIGFEDLGKIAACLQILQFSLLILNDYQIFAFKKLIEHTI